MAEFDQTFDTYQQWVNKASSWLTRHPDYRSGLFQPICFDAHGRHCRIGGDFMRAREEGTFPVRWLWPDQIATLGRTPGDVDGLIKAEPLFVRLTPARASEEPARPDGEAAHAP